MSARGNPLFDIVALSNVEVVSARIPWRQVRREPLIEPGQSC
jgi:hypothetical protein